MVTTTAKLTTLQILCSTMINQLLSALGLVCMVMCGCHGFRYGAPMETCGHMFPNGHGYDARTDTPPFNFYLSQTTYNPNDTITVFMNSSINPANPTYEWFMEGVLIQARTLDCNAEVSVGTFSVPECDDFLQVVDCFGLKKSAIRHYTHLHVYNKTFTWTAPSQPVGHVYFRATIARNQEKFWTNVFSAVIRDPTDSNTNMTLCPVISKQSEITSAAANVNLHSFALMILGIIFLFY